MNNQRIYLNKERLVALIDAVLAIIMTLLVLNLQKPAEPTLAGFWALRNSYFSYTLSFFWLGILWLSLNQFFAQINAIGSRTVIIGLVMLFVCSLVPYLTMLDSDDFHSQLIQTIFGVGTGRVNLLFIALLHTMDECAYEPASLPIYIHEQTRLLLYSPVTKLAGIGICWMVYPPAVMFSIVFSAVFSVLYTNVKPLKIGRADRKTGAEARSVYP